MRAMSHNSRTNSAGKVHGSKHNDRNFDTSKADNINPDPERKNLYWNCYRAKEVTFEEVELAYYKSAFGEMLD